MSDIVERLRETGENHRGRWMTAKDCFLMTEAADEIERLREYLQKIISISDRNHNVWNAAKAFLRGEKP